MEVLAVIGLLLVYLLAGALLIRGCLYLFPDVIGEVVTGWLGVMVLVFWPFYLLVGIIFLVIYLLGKLAGIDLGEW